MNISIQNSVEICVLMVRDFPKPSSKGFNFALISSVFFNKIKFLTEAILDNEISKQQKLSLLEVTTFHNKFITDCLTKTQKYTQSEALINGPEIDKAVIDKFGPIKSEISSKDFVSLCQNTLEKKLEQYAADIGIKITSHNFRFTSEEIATNNLSIEKARELEADYDCMRFTVYHQFKSTFRDRLYCKYENQGDFMLPPIFAKFLHYNNYKPVSETPIMKDDIVFYLSQQGQNTVFKHIGVALDSDTVISKWGTLPQIFAHPIGTVPYDCLLEVYRRDKQ